jgi:hypothetical protein
MVGEAGLKAAALENVRRYRAIASLCRQTASFRPEQKMSLLQQAEDWERLAVRELIECEPDDESSDENLIPQEELQEDELQEDELQTEPQVDTRWWLPRREGLFAGLQA